MTYLLVCALAVATGGHTVLNKHPLSVKERAALECDSDLECEGKFYLACKSRHPNIQGVEGWLESYPADRGGK